jgi:hypothetical protein
MRTRGLNILSRPGHPDFLDLDWNLPLITWEGDRLVEVVRGVHRHVVRFVVYDDALYAMKELPPRLAEREYRMLRHMAEEGLPVVEVVGVARRQHMDVPGGPLENVLITRYLDYSLPYRTLFTHRRAQDASTASREVDYLTPRLLDALAILLVRMHLDGFYWGDCSLSNVLFRRDAGELAAYIVDMETGDWHPQLSDGQRRADLEVTELNVAGGLMDLQAELDLPAEPDPAETATDLRRRYDRLWDELTTGVIVAPDERYRIAARIRRLNELGFDVDEVELVSTAGGDKLRLRTVVAEQGHHRRRLMALTGLRAQENQARSLLNDLANYRASLERRTGRGVPETIAAHRWLAEVFQPAVEAIPEHLAEKLEPVEVFHGVIEHKWFLSERAGVDVGVEEAVRSYIDTILPSVPDERLLILSDDERAEGWIGYG